MDHREAARIFYERVASNHLPEEVGRYIAEDCVVRMGEHSVPVGVEGMRQHLAEVRKTYPDLRMTVIRQFVDGDTVLSECIMEGTHLGEWLGMKPSGKRLRMSCVNIDTFKDGKIIAHGGAVNTLEALWEAGLLQPAEPSAP